MLAIKPIVCIWVNFDFIFYIFSFIVAISQRIVVWQNKMFRQNEYIIGLNFNFYLLFKIM